MQVGSKKIDVTSAHRQEYRSSIGPTLRGRSLAARRTGGRVNFRCGGEKHFRQKRNLRNCCGHIARLSLGGAITERSFPVGQSLRTVG